MTADQANTIIAEAIGVTGWECRLLGTPDACDRFPACSLRSFICSSRKPIDFATPAGFFLILWPWLLKRACDHPTLSNTKGTNRIVKWFGRGALKGERLTEARDLVAKAIAEGKER